MKQILQSLKTGITEVAEVPCPVVRHGQLLIRSSCTLVSAGTDRMLIKFGKAGWIEKACHQLDKVRMVLDKMGTDGLMPTIKAVFNKLDRPLPLGYCNVGEILEVGSGVTNFAVGDRVVSNGCHAEIVCVSEHFSAKIPKEVGDESATFALIGAIGMEGLRLAKPSSGETFAVIGLGLVGLMTLQLLKAHGCHVIGVDFNQERLRLAKLFGAETVDLSLGEDPVRFASSFSQGKGVDGVLITAATRSNEPIHQAAQMCKKRGRIVLIGVVGLHLSREDFYEKELSFQVSCSYGPKHEENPPWTVRDNFDAVLQIMANHQLDIAPLISHRFPFNQAKEAYRLLLRAGSSLGIVFQYPGNKLVSHQDRSTQTVQITSTTSRPSSSVVVGFVGAGNHAAGVLVPSFKKSGAVLKSIASIGGVSAIHVAKKFGIVNAMTDARKIIDDREINTIVVATRHDTHAQFVCDALKAGKHVFVEKPLAIYSEELTKIESVYRSIQSLEKPLVLMVGFNRRFAPQVKKMKSLLEGIREPKSFVMTVNAGYLSPGHWVNDPKIGGGRIIGEVCHFIDLLRFLAGSKIVSAKAINGETFTFQFDNNSAGTIHYLTEGHRSFPKERLEVFCGGRTLQLDNFRTLKGFGWPGFKKMVLWRQDKGHFSAISAFMESLRRSQPSPIPFEEIVEVTRIVFEIAKARS